MSSDISKSIINELREENAQLKDQLKIYKNIAEVLMDCFSETENAHYAAKNLLFHFHEQSNEPKRHTKNRRRA